MHTIYYSIFAALFVCISAREASRHLIGSNLACPSGSRIRKSWDVMTPAAQDLYREAVETAIASGKHQAMVKVHQEARSELEAHETCGFVLWHRRYLLAYENMLRAQNSKFKCIFIPYWPVMENFNDLHDGKCTSFLDCSPILTGLGGSPGEKETRTYSEITRTGLCQSESPYSNFKDDNGDSACLPRSDTSKKPVPSGASYSSLFNMITKNTDYKKFTEALQDGVHNEVHASTGGIMSSWAAPVDVLFYSWHATVDMMHYIWHQCHVSNPLLGKKALKSKWAFNSGECRRTAKATNTVASGMNLETEIYMASDGKQVLDHPVLKEAFSDMGTAYLDYVDSRALGEYTYSYEIPDSFMRILDNKDLCKGYATSQIPVPTSSTTEPTTEEPADSNDEDETPVDGDSTEESTEDTMTYWEWYDATKANLEKTFPDDPDQVSQQLEYLDCIGIDETFGVPESIGDEGLQDSIIAHPKCAELLEAIAKKEVIVDTEAAPKKWGVRKTKDNKSDTPTSTADKKKSQKTVTFFLMGFTMMMIMV